MAAPYQSIGCYWQNLTDFLLIHPGYRAPPWPLIHLCSGLADEQTMVLALQGYPYQYFPLQDQLLETVHQPLTVWLSEQHDHHHHLSAAVEHPQPSYLPPQ